MYLQPVNYPTIYASGTISACEDYAPGSRSGSWSVDEVRCNRVYSSKIKVYCSSKYTGPVAIVSSLGLQLGQPYQFPIYAAAPTESDSGSFLQSIKADQDTEHSANGSIQWTVSLEYAPFDIVHQLGVSDIAQGIICPTDAVPEVLFDQAKYRRAKTEDESTPALPYINTVGDPLLDTPETEETRPVLIITRNEATYNDAYASQYKDTVNSDEFLGFPPNTVKCADIKPERIYDPDWGYYFRVTYRFEFRDDDDGNGYSQLILNAGYRQLVDGEGEPTNVVDGSGNQVTDAVALQKNGSYQPSAEPYFLEFNEFPAMPFADLAIPDDILSVNS